LTALKALLYSYSLHKNVIIRNSMQSEIVPVVKTVFSNHNLGTCDDDTEGFTCLGIMVPHSHIQKHVGCWCEESLLLVKRLFWWKLLWWKNESTVDVIVSNKHEFFFVYIPTPSPPTWKWNYEYPDSERWKVLSCNGFIQNIRYKHAVSGISCLIINWQISQNSAKFYFVSPISILMLSSHSILCISVVVLKDISTQKLLPPLYSLLDFSIIIIVVISHH
jgi:hypothetical protein